ncbi:hypothetical protein HanPI659440_Chr17g0688311 [Helianthus annuus]|nr:hypothetical protein HanPI659440_Chr17g0688311 [Helianthus annuus]
MNRRKRKVEFKNSLFFMSCMEKFNNCVYCLHQIILMMVAMCMVPTILYRQRASRTLQVGGENKFDSRGILSQEKDRKNE